MPEYDNTNRGSLWMTWLDGKPCPGLSGNLDIDGTPTYCDLIRCGTGDDGRPTHRLYVRTRDGAISATALWKPKSAGSKSIASGKLTHGGREYWAHLLPTEKKSDRSPAAALKLHPVEDEKESKPQAPASDDVPF